ncbi:MAG: hypothetical protein GY940_13455 [bacterium]|nr:hypothetical protein [bacterium]
MMNNREKYQLKLEAIRSVPSGEIKAPHHIPVDTYIRESEVLHRWCQSDKEALTAGGLSWELVEDLPLRIGALIEADALWYVRRTKGRETDREWAKRSPAAYKLLRRLLKSFRFAFREHDLLLKAVREVAGKRGHPAMVQDLSNLAALGRKHSPLLEAVGFDLSLLDDASRTSDEMGKLLADTAAGRLETDQTKKIRDQAYTYLKTAVDRVREYGKYVFDRGTPRYNGYVSLHLRKYRQRKKREAPAKS